MLKPHMSSYDINALICLLNMAQDEFSRNKIKMAVIEKILSFDNSILYLLNKFMRSKTDVLKEVYADVILMNMKGNDYYIHDDIVDELLSYASLDALMYYGADSLSYNFNIKCKEEFWRRAFKIENEIELQRKRKLEKMF